MMTEFEPQAQAAFGDDTLPRSILLVDDDTMQAGVLQQRLTRQGYVTFLAHDGHAAMEIARRHHPHVVLLDVALPDINGLDVCEALNDGQETCDIPVIVLSGTGGAEMVRRARAAGSRFYVHKPYDPNVLLALIEDAMADDDFDWT